MVAGDIHEPANPIGAAGLNSRTADIADENVEFFIQV
jgi:hypothetical protein